MIRTAELPPHVRGALACPLCKGELAIEAELIECRGCAAAFPQHSPDHLDLLPPEASRPRFDHLDEGRQAEMEAWYELLLDDPGQAGRLLAFDYQPHVQALSGMRGSVLDIGGGLGIPRQFLPQDCTYVVVDPSLLWRDERWTGLASHLPCLETPPSFIRGLGECLPFATGSQDVVLAFWALNHAASPERLVSEIGRVLRPGGRALLVLEDMIPSRRDILRRSAELARERKWLAATEYARLLLGYGSREWPLQSDHVRVDEPALLQWAAPVLRLVRREWLGGFLTFEFERMVAASDTPPSPAGST